MVALFKPLDKLKKYFFWQIWQLNNITCAVSSVKGNIVDGDVAVGSVRAPGTFEDDAILAFFRDTHLGEVPRGSLIIVQLPYRRRGVEAFANGLYEYSQNP